MTGTEEERQVMCQLMIPRSLEAALAEIARTEHTTVNGIIYEALSEKVRRRTGRPKKDERQR